MSRPAPPPTNTPRNECTHILSAVNTHPSSCSRPILTRDATPASQKAEILKLRLSLATYKVKTNQTDVPLDKLQIRPVPGMTRRHTPLPSMSAHTVERATPAQYWYRSLPSSQTVEKDSDDDGEEKSVEEEGEEEEKEKEVDDRVLPKLGVVSTPRRRGSVDDEAWLTSSALRGGAAKGLLSLSQASS